MSGSIVLPQAHLEMSWHILSQIPLFNYDNRPVIEMMFCSGADSDLPLQ